MNKVEKFEKIRIVFRMRQKCNSVYLFQIKNQDNLFTILLKIENGYAKIIIKQPEEEDRIIDLGCYLRNTFKHEMFISIDETLDISINDKFYYSIGSLGFDLDGIMIYEPSSEAQKGLRILKFGKTND